MDRDQRARTGVGQPPAAMQAEPRRGGAMPFRDRLYAWWEGIDLPLPPAEAPPAPARWVPPDGLPALAPPTRPSAVAPAAWPPDRIAAAQLLWGPDCLEPGEPGLTVELARPFGAGPATRLADLHAGLGAGCRAVATRFGVWVTGLEPDPDLARAAQARARALSMERKAPVTAYDPARLELSPAGFDCILAREILFAVPDKGRLLDSVREGLRVGGQLILTDLLTRDGTSGPALAAWAAAEPRLPAPWPVARLTAALLQRGFDLRLREDLTSLFRGQIRTGLRRLLARIDAGAVDSAVMRPALREGDRWARRLVALESGELAIWRFHAVKRAG